MDLSSVKYVLFCHIYTIIRMFATYNINTFAIHVYIIHSYTRCYNIIHMFATCTIQTFAIYTILHVCCVHSAHVLVHPPHVCFIHTHCYSHLPHEVTIDDHSHVYYLGNACAKYDVDSRVKNVPVWRQQLSNCFRIQ